MPNPAPHTPPPSPARKKQLGQFFTRDAEVQRVMCELVSHARGRALEPSAGEGHLAAALASAHPGLDVEAVELDRSLSWPHPKIPLQRGDFFAFAAGRDRHYDVIFGNPPYVAWKNCDAGTRQAAAEVKARYQDKANLYYLFIDRCLDLLAPGGELVFIVPAEWSYATTAAPLREKMAATGTVTDIIHCGEEKLFADASVPAIMIFRFVAARPQGKVRYGRGLSAWAAGKRDLVTLQDRGGRWMLLDDATSAAVAGWGRLGDQYAVRVGLVTGADDVFRPPLGLDIEGEALQQQVTTSRRSEPFINVNTAASFEEIPPKAAKYLLAHKDRLLARRIARFDEGNWWRYGAIRNDAHMAAPGERFFALAKTRHPEPFFTCPGAKHFAGGVLGLFRRPGAIPVELAVKVLNSPRYRAVLEAMLLTTGDKVSLQPATLEDTPFPTTVSEAEAFLHAKGASVT